MTDLLIAVLNLTISGGAAAGIVWILRLFLRRMPGVYSYILWLLVFFRFASPFTLETALSLFPVNRESVEPDIVYEMAPAVHTGIGVVDRAANSVLQGAFAGNPQGSVNPLQVALAIGTLAWAAGIAVILAVQIGKLLRLRGRLRTAVRLEGEEGAVESEWVEVPAVFGILHPVIVLPFGIPEGERRWILAHERAHIARRDHLVKAVCFVITVVHWFNPMAWIAYGKLCLDMEISCDERAVRHMGAEERKAYSMALLQFAGRRSGLWISPAFGESHTRERVRRVLASRRRTAGCTAVACACTALAGCCLLTSPEPDVSVSAVTIIGGADGPTSIFLAGKTGEGEESLSYRPALWEMDAPAESAALGWADAELPDAGAMAVICGAPGVTVFVSEDGELREVGSVNLGALDERYRELYSGSTHSELGFSVKAAGNAVVMGMTQAGEWLPGHMYLLLADSGELYRTDGGERMAEIFESLERQAGLSGDSQGKSPESMVLVSETGLLQDLAIEITGRGGTVLCPLFFQ